MFTSFDFDFFFILATMYLALTAVIQLNFRFFTILTVKLFDRLAPTDTSLVALTIVIGCVCFAPWVIAAIHDWKVTLTVFVIGSALDFSIMLFRRNTISSIIAASFNTEDSPVIS